MDEKYVVLKKDEWEEFKRQQITLRDLQDAPEFPDTLDDAVVIRTRDIFAGPVLHTYAGAVQTAIEVINGTDAQLSSLWVSDLEKVRDYFTERANEADDIKAKRFPSP